MMTETILPGHGNTPNPVVPVRGLYFYHARILSGDYDGVTPQLCKVTKVARDGVYYRTVHVHGEREELGGGEYATLERFAKLALADDEAQRRIEAGKAKQQAREQEIHTT